MTEASLPRPQPEPPSCTGVSAPAVLGISGYSGSGKTQLLVQLIPELATRGLRVSTLKHAHHRFDVDQPGKDSHRHRLAGAQQVLISSAQRWVLMNELRGAAEPSLAELLLQLAPVDLVLVEGFKRESFAKIEVSRRAAGKPSLWQDPEFAGDIIAVASPDAKPQACTLPWLDLDDPTAIADFIISALGLAHGST